MKKSLSLILAALLCAATTTVVAAEDVIEAPAEDVSVDTTDVLVPETQVAPYDTEAIVAYAAEAGIVITAEFVDAIFMSDAIPTVESLLALAAEYEIVLTEEQAQLVLDVLGAYLIAPLADVLLPEDAIGGEVTGTDILVIDETVINETDETVIDAVIDAIEGVMDEILGAVDALLAGEEIVDGEIEFEVIVEGEPAAPEEAAVLETEVAEEAAEVVEEEKSLFTEIPTFGLFSKTPMPVYNFLPRG